MNKRKEWSDYIKTSLVGRLSYLRGNSQFHVDSLPPCDEIESFIRQFIKETDRKLIFYIYFLNSSRFQRFVKEAVPDLLKAASHQSKIASVRKRGAIKGKVDWSSSVMLQKISGDPNVFETSIIVKSSDTPENRIIKHFLAMGIEISNYVVQHMDDGLQKDFAESYKKKQLAFLSHPYLRSVVHKGSATNAMKKHLKRHRDPRYRDLVSLVEQMESLTMIWSWSAALSLIQQGYLAPLSDDDLFELYVLLRCHSILSEQMGLGIPFYVGPISSGREAVLKYKLPKGKGGVVSLFFDQSPSAYVKYKSYYMQLAKKYDIKVAERRPDISLVINSVNESKRTEVLLLEVKNTSDPSYVRDSIYKVLGYIKDFSQLWGDERAEGIKILLVLPNVMSCPASLEKDHDEVVIVSPDRLSHPLECFVSK